MLQIQETHQIPTSDTINNSLMRSKLLKYIDSVTKLMLTSLLILCYCRPYFNSTTVCLLSVISDIAQKKG